MTQRHSCGRLNDGFPDHSKRKNHGHHPKDEYERMMRHETKNMLSDEDIRNLNNLGNQPRSGADSGVNATVTVNNQW